MTGTIPGVREQFRASPCNLPALPARNGGTPCARRLGMAYQPSVLCPVDFSDPSRAALNYAAAIADHFGARLTVLTVDDPLLAEVAATTGRVPSLERETDKELRRFVGDTLPHLGASAKTVAFRVA